MTQVPARVGATIEPGTSLKGNTQIGEECAIGPHTTITDSEIGDGVSIPHSYLVQAKVEDHGTIGPFAYLRPDAHLHPNAKAGAFVEIKTVWHPTGRLSLSGGGSY